VALQPKIGPRPPHCLGFRSLTPGSSPLT